MRRERRFPWRWVVGAAVLAGIAALVAVLVRGPELPDTPQPVAWNRQACAHCRMLVGEPASAAQLVATDGTVEFFDDPGCLLRSLDGRNTAVHRMWFHDHRSERWLASDEVGFVTGATTPMGYGLAAVPRATPGAIDLGEARRRINARSATPDAHGGAP